MIVNHEKIQQTGKIQLSWNYPQFLQQKTDKSNFSFSLTKVPTNSATLKRKSNCLKQQSNIKINIE